MKDKNIIDSLIEEAYGCLKDGVSELETAFVLARMGNSDLSDFHYNRAKAILYGVRRRINLIERIINEHETGIDGREDAQNG